MRSQSLQYIVCIQNKYGFYRITRHEAHIGLRQNRVQLDNKKSCICAGNRLVCWHQIHRIQ